MHGGVNEEILIAFALDELSPSARRTVEEAAAADPELARHLAAYRAIVSTARTAPEASAPPPRVLEHLLAAQAALARPRRAWSYALLRLTPVLGTLVLAVFLGTGLTEMGDALEPHPTVSTGAAPSDALLVASRVTARPRASVTPLRASTLSTPALAAWDTLSLRAIARDSGSADSL